MLEILAQSSLVYLLAVGILVLLSVEAAVNLRRAWAVPALCVYATVAAWYILEPLYTPDEFFLLPAGDIETSFLQVAAFLVSFRLLLPLLLRHVAPRAGATPPVVGHLAVARPLAYLVVVWLILIAFGLYRMNGDVMATLFPLQARTGAQMWSRAAGAEAGDFGFAISVAAYLHVLTSAAFGMLWPFATSTAQRASLLFMIALSWPFFFLFGSRNMALAVAVPALASYLLFHRHRILVKACAALAALITLDVFFKAAISVRDRGWDALFSGEVAVREATHLGLNMATELVHLNGLLRNGHMSLYYGTGYLVEALNFIPRAIWADKPLIGIEYALARGFGGSDADVGVFATVSTGLIGQGVLNFGPIFGPIAPAALMACWVALLSRFRQQNTLPRLLLFLMGIGLTFNLGRDLTLLVLWPMLLGYAAALLAEKGFPHLFRTARSRPQPGLRRH